MIKVPIFNSYWFEIGKKKVERTCDCEVVGHRIMNGTYELIYFKILEMLKIATGFDSTGS